MRFDLIIALLGVGICGICTYGVGRGLLLVFITYLLMPSARGPNG